MASPIRRRRQGSAALGSARQATRFREFSLRGGCRCREALSVVHDGTTHSPSARRFLAGLLTMLSPKVLIRLFGTFVLACGTFLVSRRWLIGSVLITGLLLALIVVVRPSAHFGIQSFRGRRHDVRRGEALSARLENGRITVSAGPSRAGPLRGRRQETERSPPGISAQRNGLAGGCTTAGAAGNEPPVGCGPFARRREVPG